MKHIETNEFQKPFVFSPNPYDAFIGGIGSGKTFSGILRGLNMAQQPRVGMHGARGLIAAVSYDVLMDVVMPEFEEICDGTDLLIKYEKSRKVAHIKGGGTILFRSLDRPNWMRGLQLSWFYLDEGRHLSKSAWEVLIGRLRQPGYSHAGWVCSTSNGLDWMYDLFHEESPEHREGYTWHVSPTTANAAHLPDDYIPMLYANYSDKEGNLTAFGRQELLGSVEGLTEGAVYPEWDRTKYVKPLAYDPSLPLYSFWDFGIGDLGVVVFAQVAQLERPGKGGVPEFVPELRVLGSLESADRNASEWALVWKAWLDKHTDGARPVANYGDPAGKARAAGSGTSVMDDLSAAGVFVAPAPKKPADYGIRILKNYMEAGRLLVDSQNAARVSAAISASRWPMDADGKRRPSKEPVHDWTSHFTSALRYGAASILSFFPRRGQKPYQPPPGPGTVGHVVAQLTRPPTDWLGPQAPTRIEWRHQVPVGATNGD